LPASSRDALIGRLDEASAISQQLGFRRRHDGVRPCSVHNTNRLTDL
jgi:hypothetical protein